MLARVDAWDRRVVRALHARMSSRFLRGTAIFFTFLAYGWNWFLLAPLSLVAPWYPAVSRLGGALIAAWCVLMLLKIAFPRTRPFRAMDLHPWWGTPRSDSFPSGHAAGAFAVATFMACWLAPFHDARDAAIVIVLGVLAIGAGCSRIFLAVHYPTDVLVGALIGIVCGGGGAHVPR